MIIKIVLLGHMVLNKSRMLCIVQVRSMCKMKISLSHSACSSSRDCFPAPQKETFFGSGRGQWRPDGSGRKSNRFLNELPFPVTTDPTSAFPPWLA